MNMTFLGKTDVGRVRETNQDKFAFYEFDESCRFAVLCDGMGGHNGGNVASEIAIDTIKEFIVSGYMSDMYKNNIDALVLDAVNKADNKIFSESLKKPNLKGMGTTVVLAFICKDKVYIAHAGDSRAYLYEDKQLLRLTIDHSLVQEMIELGQITAKEAEKHPYKNVITRALGKGSDVELDMKVIDAVKGSYIMLCSDGLSNLLSMEDMEEIINDTPSEDLCEELISEANKKGGYDNITVVFIKCK